MISSTVACSAIKYLADLCEQNSISDIERRVSKSHGDLLGSIMRTLLAKQAHGRERAHLALSTSAHDGKACA